MEINGEKEYVICNPMGFGTTTPPPNGKQVVNIKGQTAESAEFESNGYYDIPYRCLIPVKIENLMAARRNLSSDVYAQSGARLVMACFTMGEVAGTAVALSLAKNMTPREVDRIILQKELIKNKVNIGQNFRNIPGLEGEGNGMEDRFENPEFNRKEHVIILQDK